MPEPDPTQKSWAEQVEQEDAGGAPGADGLPPPKEELVGDNVKIITEYRLNDDEKRVMIVKTYKTETRKVSKSIAGRKAWKKFGAASRDQPGPNPANTIIAEAVFMQFVHSKEQQQGETEDDQLQKMKQTKMVACRICKGDHWTTRCPYKDTLVPLQESAAGTEGAGADKKGTEGEGAAGTKTLPGAAAGGSSMQAGGKPGKYVPPNVRDGGNRKGESMMMKGGQKDDATIRVTNLSEDTRENDLQELFRPFGQVARIFLAKDKASGQSKGFAFITFQRREDAARAIAGVSGFGYDHLILKVEWAKPSGTT